MKSNLAGFKIAVICNNDIYCKHLRQNYDWTFIYTEEQFWSMDYQSFDLICFQLLMDRNRSPSQKQLIECKKVKHIRDHSFSPIVLLGIFPSCNEFPPNMLLTYNGVTYYQLNRLNALPKLIYSQIFNPAFPSGRIIAIEELKSLYEEMDTCKGHHSIYSALSDFDFNIRVIKKIKVGLSIYHNYLAPKLYKLYRTLNFLGPLLPQGNKKCYDVVFGDQNTSMVMITKGLLYQSEELIEQGDYHQLKRFNQSLLGHLTPKSEASKIIKRYALTA